MMGPRKLIIDTDPGVDDSMALACAWNSPDIDVIGLTTIFGNVRTEKATENAIFLRALAGRDEIPVAQGSPSSLAGVLKEVSAFVHGDDGFGNTNQKMVKGKKIDKTAAQFIADTIRANPGQVSVLALGPLTNLAMAFQISPEVGKYIDELIILGGAFNVMGNVNPAAEANILGDPDAADFVFGQTERIRCVGLDVTLTCQLPNERLETLKGSSGKFGPFLHQIIQFYLQYHRDSYGMDGIFAHDPTAFIAVNHPELFTWQEGQVRVLTEGIAKGKTMQDPGKKTWNAPNGWDGRPKVKVAIEMDTVTASDLMMKLMTQ